MRLAIVVLLVLLSSSAQAQIVNVQNLLGAETPDGLSGALDMGADWRTGNTELLIFSGAATLRYRSDPHLVFAVARGAYGETGEGEAEELIAKNHFEHLRYRYKLSELVTPEAFVQHEFDEFRRLQLRALGGAGVRLTVLQKKELGLAFGVAYMLEYEELNDAEGAVDAGETYTNHRLSTYALVAVGINEHVTLVNTVYFQPRFDAFADDFRVLDETQLQVKLTDHFSLKVSFVLAHDSDPPDLVEGTDTSMQTAVAVRF
jgi:putative salt-induced outer membrane protein YdiY